MFMSTQEGVGVRRCRIRLGDRRARLHGSWRRWGVAGRLAAVHHLLRDGPTLLVVSGELLVGLVRGAWGNAGVAVFAADVAGAAMRAGPVVFHARLLELLRVHVEPG